jgi:hypothetical protein
MAIATASLFKEHKERKEGAKKAQSFAKVFIGLC